MQFFYSETAKELLSRGAWWRVLQYTYINDDGEETTPFRELVQHMPGMESYNNYNSVYSTSVAILEKNYG